MNSVGNSYNLKDSIVTANEKTFADFSPAEFYYNLNRTNAKSLSDRFESIKKEQGMIAGTWDKIKIFLGLSNNSQNVEKMIQKAVSGEISQEEAQKAVDKFSKRQNTASECVQNFISSVAVMGITAISPLKKRRGLCIAASILTGVLSRVAVGAFEASTNKVDGDYTKKEIIKDSMKGLVIGTFGSAGKFSVKGLEDKVYFRLSKFLCMNIITSGPYAPFRYMIAPKILEQIQQQQESKENYKPNSCQKFFTYLMK